MAFLRIAACFLIAATSLSPGVAQERMGFANREIEAHRLGGTDMIDVPATISPTFHGLDIEVEISATGDVTAARVAELSATSLSGDGAAKAVRVSGNLEEVDSGPALAAVRTWKFRPFTFQGKPVVAIGNVRIGYRVPGRWRDASAAFPPVDYASLRVELSRSSCFGDCPAYAVSIDGTGKVIFSPGDRPDRESLPASANRDLNAALHRESRIDRATLDALIDRFRAARFFGLERSYEYGVTDQPTYVLRFSTGGQVMEVSDYVGEPAGMPHIVTELEDAVDAAAGTARWVKGDAETAPALIAAGLDPASKAARILADRSLQDGDVVAIGLIERGLVLDVPFDQFGTKKPVPFGSYLLIRAVEQGRPALYTALASRGWLARTGRDALNRAFADGAGGCDPALAEALARNGIDPDARGSEGRTALINAVKSHQGCKGATASVVAALIRLGADPNATDDDGRTALFGLEIPDLQEQLLAMGARVDIRAKDGGTALELTDDDRTAMGLLEAGADPSGRDFEGRTLEQRAADGMPATLAWLDAHRSK
jgi:hypothetical protein